MWRSDMQVWLERHGAGGVHQYVMTTAKWEDLAARVRAWEDDALAAALALLDGEDSSSNSTAGGSTTTGSTSAAAAAAPAVSEVVLDARRKAKALVERSMKAYGAIYTALPEDLRKQAESLVPSGFAYGLWHWLETKFQSTEQDSVGELLCAVGVAGAGWKRSHSTRTSLE